MNCFLKTCNRQLLQAGVAAMALTIGILQAPAADLVKASKSVAEGFGFALLEVGEEAGIFKKHGIELETTTFGGGGKQMQALSAGAVDIALGSGASMVVIAKGAPAMTVGEYAGPPLSMALITTPDSPIKTMADLKGKRIAVTSATSLTAWLARQVAIHQGWDKDAVKVVPMGGTNASFAGVVAGNADALVASNEFALPLEAAGRARVVRVFGDFIKDYTTHVVFASNKMIKERPDVLRRFLAAWYETIAWAKQNKGKTVEIASRVINVKPELTAKIYDNQMDMFYTDGHFRPKNIAVMKASFLERGQLKKEPSDKELFTEEFLPKK
jgi:ABC-type nitrate/sulfonate/bicarbonate transport system substrate-binding protein